jgi:hypothetical protein
MKRWLTLMGVAGVSVVLGYCFGTAQAEGVPELGALTYSGTIIEAGVPATGAKDLEVGLWTSFSGGTDPVCKVVAPATRIELGRFRVSLDPCLRAIHSHRDLYVELKINGTLLSRTKLGVVPYAAEAANSVKTTYVDPVGTRRLSSQGRICGYSSPGVDGRMGTDGGVSGYPGAKGVCERAEGCGPSAHMCLAEEVIRILQLGGVAPTTGWIATGYVGQASGSESCITVNDCASFTSNSVDLCGTVLNGAGITTLRCDNTVPVLCCD